jgi:hypothetical protein
MTMAHPYRTISAVPSSPHDECTHRCLGCAATSLFGRVSLWRVLLVAATAAILSLNIGSALVALYSVRLTATMVADEATLARPVQPSISHAPKAAPPPPAEPVAAPRERTPDTKFPSWHFDAPHAAEHGILEVAPGEIVVDREVVDSILAETAELTSFTRISPERQDGKAVGVRIFGIRPSTMLSKLGFMNGDRLDAVNGWDVSSPEQALEAYARLRTSDEILIALTRNGSRRFLRFHVR